MCLTRIISSKDKKIFCKHLVLSEQNKFILGNFHRAQKKIKQTAKSTTKNLKFLLSLF